MSEEKNKEEDINLNTDSLNTEENNQNNEPSETDSETSCDNCEASEESCDCEPEKNIFEEKYNDCLDKYQRLFAEFDNFRKRTAKEKTSMFDDGVRTTVEKLLPVLDNLERAVSAQEEKTPDDAFFKGVAMTLKQLNEVLVSIGVEEIEALGEKFDPNLHAAVAHEDNEEFGESEVIVDMLKGYKYKDKVIRHSMVKVAN